MRSRRQIRKLQPWVSCPLNRQDDEREQTLLNELLRPYPAEEMVGHAVSVLVNSPGNKETEVIEGIQLNSA
ncbi:MAG: hypothetical protein H7Z16_04390 [Pyrinomonadaceae bacterium]|nr:hypothetical protein [Pyrinomonadaceae bacterium]